MPLATKLPNAHLFILAIWTSFTSLATFGFQFAVVNVPINVIQQAINETYLYEFDEYPSERTLSGIWALIVGIYQLGAVGGCLLAIPLANRFGRRKCLMVWTNLVVFISSIILATAQTAELFELVIIGRLIIGFGAGLAIGLLPVYLIECSPKESRGFVVSLHGVAVTIWYLIAALMAQPIVLGNKENWMMLMAFCLFPAVMQIATFPLCPESPVHLYINRKNEDQAVEILREYHSKDYKNICDTLEELNREAELAKQSDSAWHRSQVKQAIIIGIVAGLALPFSGHSVVLTYSTLLLMRTGNSEMMSQRYTPILLAVQLGGAILSAFLVDRLGRRWLLIGGLTLTLAGNLAFFVLYFLRYQDYANNDSWLPVTSFVVLTFTVFIFSVGPNSIPYFLAAELTPAHKRVLASSVASMPIFLGSMVTTFVFPILDREIGPWSFLILFALPSVPLIAFLTLRMPETNQQRAVSVVEEMNLIRISSSEEEPICSALLQRCNPCANRSYGSTD